MKHPSRVESVKQSPLNSKQWCYQLDCGHDQWVTAKRRPTRQRLYCQACAQAEDEEGRKFVEELRDDES